MEKKYFAIEQKADARHADVYIFGDIVPFEFLNGDVSATGFVSRIKDLDVDQIDVHIDSYGGAVSEGWAIYNALVDHPAKVVTWGDGFVASAALFPFLAGDERHASALSAYYMHEVSTGAYGYAKDLRAAANEVEIMTGVGVQAFVNRAGMDEKTVRELMQNETWLEPGAALEYGIATDIVADSAPKHTQGAKRFLIERALEKKPEQKKEAEKQRENALMLFLSGKEEE